MRENENIAVLTCDIVGSSLLKESELREYQHKIETLDDQRILIVPQFYRGDSFQLATSPKDALDIATLIRIEMKRVHEKNDVRVSVGIGKIKIFSENVLLATGSAFEISGKNLDQLKGLKLNLYVQTDKEQINDELETYCYFADAIMTGFTKIQSNIIYYKLKDLGQNEIANVLKISQPAVSKSLKISGWQNIERFLKRYKTLINKNYRSDD